MPFFPQLTTGAAAQYPLERTRVFRTIASECSGGHQAKLASPGGAFTEWNWQLTGLSQAEAAALESLFTLSEGRLKTFGFLDPASNLLRYSEALSQSVWLRDPLIQVATGFTGPEGGPGGHRITNAGGVTASISQDIAAPGGYQYCFSVWMKSAQGSGLTLVRSAGAASASETWTGSIAWRHCVLSGQLTGTTVPVRFSLRLDPGAVIDVWGLQVEAQVAPSPYKKTTASSGLYPDAAFAQDTLVVSADGINDFSAHVRIASLTGV